MATIDFPELRANVAGIRESAAHADRDALASHVDELARIADAALDARDVLAAALEAQEAQLEAQRALLADIGCPILQVRSDALCVPLVGEFDPDRAARLTDELLTAAIARRVRLAVIDLTGALILDAATAGHIGGLLQGLALIGVRGVLSGVRPEFADLLAATIRGRVPCFPDLARALAAHTRPGP